MSFVRESWLWHTGKRIYVDPVRRSLANISCRGRIPLSWFPGPNWGDALNPVLVRMLAGKPVKLTQAHYCDQYLAIGSILGNAHSRTTVWGSGFIRDGEMVPQEPKAIHAVRGPLTRAALIGAGIDCPEVYGDPALLLPLFYDPETPKLYEIGIIPHYVDKSNPWILAQSNLPGVHIIDVEGDTWEFIRTVKACRIILSSSLHGLICADAYGVPNAWIKLSNGVVGGDFKFRDYRLSIGGCEPVPIDVRTSTRLASVAKLAGIHPIHVDLRRLLTACPFLSIHLRKRIETLGCGTSIPPLFLADFQRQ